MTRTLRLPLAALTVLATAALGLSACGSDAPRASGQDVARVLDGTFAETGRPIDSGRLALTLDVRAAGVPGLPSPLHTALAGPFQTGAAGTAPKFRFDASLATRDGRIEAGLISTGRRAWVKVGQRAYAITPAQASLLVGTAAPGPTAGGLTAIGLDPRRWLRGTTEVGVEELAGVQVTHLRAQADTAAMLRDLSGVLDRTGGLAALAGVDAPSAAAAAGAVRSAQVDVWTGAHDRRLRRLLVVVHTKTAAQPAGRVRLDIAIAGVGEPQAIGPPAGARPLSELQSALAALRRLRSGAGGP